MKRFLIALVLSAAFLLTAVSARACPVGLNLYPAVTTATVFVQPAYVLQVQPAVLVAQQAYAAPAATVAPAPDPGLANGSYGVAPASVASGYATYSGVVGSFGVMPLYYNSFGFHAYNFGTRSFVRVRSSYVNNLSLVRGFSGAGFNQQVVIANGRRSNSVVAQNGGFAGQQTVINQQRSGLFGRRVNTTVVQQGGGVGGQQAVINNGRRR